jgi:protein gp37
MSMDRTNLEQRIDILQILEDQVVFLKNEELAGSLIGFRTENVNWILNMLQDMLGQMQDALDLEDFSENWN